jgi:hypothetical protein
MVASTCRTGGRVLKSFAARLSAVICLSLVSTAPAHASTAGLGSTAPAGLTANSSITSGYLQHETAAASPSYRVPGGGGVITSWSVRGGNNAAGSARIKVGRLVPAAFSRYLIVSHSDFVTVPKNTLVAVTNQHIAAAPGDVIGIVADGKVPFFTGTFLPGDLWDSITPFTGGDPQPGLEVNAAGSGNNRVNVAAIVESDNDGDLLGDDSQDVDDDNDGISDAAEIAAGTNPLSADTDGDGLPDGSDPRPLFPDTDQDGVANAADNCPTVPNPTQADRDRNQRGDACDPDRTAPVVSRYRLSPTAFLAARSGPTARLVRRPPTGTFASYRLSEDARITISVTRAAAGRRRGRTCERPSARNRRGRRCTRYLAVRGTFQHADRAGSRRLRFMGRIGGHRLARGRYRLVLTARDAAGNRSKPAARAFRIL